MEKVNNLGFLIRKKRIEKGLTQSELAIEIGVSQQRISQYELNLLKPSAPKLAKLMQVLDINIIQVLTFIE